MTHQLENENISKLLLKYSVPAVIAMIVNTIYNIVDRIFIGKYAGEEALAGLTMAFPVIFIVFAGCALVGRGGANLISVYLGQKDNEKAGKMFGNTVSAALILGTFLVITGFLTLDILLGLLGAEGNVMVYAESYLKIIYGGIFFQLISFILNSTARAEGMAKLSMISMVVSALTNIILDYIFVVQFNLHVEGAAYATIISQLVGSIFLIHFYLSGKSIVKFNLKSFVPHKETLLKMTAIGAPAFTTTVGSGISMLLFNYLLQAHGGTGAVAAMGAIGSIGSIIFMPIYGINIGFQPIAGYNFGAGLFKRVREALYLVMFYGVIVSTLIFLFIQWKAGFILSFFLDVNSSTFSEAIHGIRLFTLIFPFICINTFGSGYFQATDNAKKALSLSSLRQFVFLVPALLILPGFFNLDGVWLSAAAADFLAVGTTVMLILPEIKKLSAKIVYA